MGQYDEMPSKKLLKSMDTMLAAINENVAEAPSSDDLSHLANLG